MHGGLSLLGIFGSCAVRRREWRGVGCETAPRVSLNRQGMKLDTKMMTNPKPTTNPAIMMK
jgi:hypothetical protein